MQILNYIRIHAIINTNSKSNEIVKNKLNRSIDAFCNIISINAKAKNPKS